MRVSPLSCELSVLSSDLSVATSHFSAFQAQKRGGWQSLIDSEKIRIPGPSFFAILLRKFTPEPNSCYQNVLPIRGSRSEARCHVYQFVH